MWRIIFGSLNKIREWERYEVIAIGSFVFFLEKYVKLSSLFRALMNDFNLKNICLNSYYFYSDLLL